MSEATNPGSYNEFVQSYSGEEDAIRAYSNEVAGYQASILLQNEIDLTDGLVVDQEVAA